MSGFDVGARLKQLRKLRDLSQRELAKRAGVTNSTISLIEQNNVSPSVSSLKKILDAMPVSISEFFAGEETSPQEKFFYRAEELTEIGDGNLSWRLVAARHPSRGMSIIHEHYPPGADTGEEMLEHEGEEGGVVIAGSIELTVNGDTQCLHAGDAYYFDSRLPHRFRNPGDGDCVIVSANTPPGFSEGGASTHHRR
ncbi:MULTISPECIES: cupin domain-containing protein [Chromohalobacter]|jgi:transcriptional regulator with XRE-family HTH domain|uniref:Transcriptional regulator, XRE family with cupin sensor protein n=1 Tax=Chromohalobacter israelensis (strain ATCC BAA-138 / DSM 3043 / CIP 106854 / NCIMB 13768 / 1H11) TaxID=290398 RepID=Q1QVS0_CHRI1|nr:MULTISPECIES: cupin domain-containing protein [Chromohalobacter]ABE59438.1 transcriptional regulator, XRE family with cupin sensor protein [Chromohalobacter salexigens DSM 3043]MBZ5874794.1 cupin domain-containing protein [Chromohalobacter salexigens]MDO0946418.1 cupin domain-containing protein [Chromohalobacter salexigens]NQY46214.1 cupin domain-containing protein [Chromohalobacter sp.]NWO56841.1 cupin domain-containing protein [Chromohalobacter salexigens]